MIRAIIVDDEPRARETLSGVITRYFTNVQLLGEAAGVNEAFTLIEKVNPNVVFLDIKMPDGSGFDLLKRFKKPTFRTVFVTAFDEFAVEAIKFSAFDYLLKPISTNELRETITKLTEEMSEPEDFTVKLQAFFDNVNSIERDKKKIVLKTANSIHLVTISNVVRCESDGNYTWFYFNHQPKLLISRPLKQFEELLEPYGFFRPHQSHLVNIRAISRIDKVDGGTLILEDNTPIPVSVRKREQLFSILEQL